jgi:hypothetical protein
MIARRLAEAIWHMLTATSPSLRQSSSLRIRSWQPMSARALGPGLPSVVSPEMFGERPREH